MEIHRRELICGAGVLAGMALLPKQAKAEVELSNEARLEKVVQNRQANQQRNQGLHQQEYRIRIRNDYQWRVVFGIFGMTSNMQWRREVNNNSTYQGSQPEIRGGERIAVLWDEWSMSVMGMQWYLVSNDMTVEINNTGVMTITP